MQPRCGLLEIFPDLATYLSGTHIMALLAPFITLTLILNIYLIERNHVSCVIIISWIKIIDLGSIDLNLMIR